MADLDLANAEFYYSNVNPITTDFKVGPYYDDFDSKNNYYKILFKPGFSVQARELTQIQSILQDQIQKFGHHVFTEGSMVLGGKYYLDKRVNYVKVGDLDVFNNVVDIESFKDQIVTGQTTGIRAYVNLVLDGSEGTDKPKTLYVSYLNGNEETDEVFFAANEPLVSNVGTLIVGNNVPVGYGSVFTISEGVRFAKNHFIYHSKQSIVVDRYDINPTCKVGFYLQESIVTANEDSSLLDPALESSNYSAPGADRFKITPIITRLDIDDVTGYPDYVNLYTLENGEVVETNERPIYNVLRREMAIRTMDESGHYYVYGFNPVVEEHLDDGANGGYRTLERGGDSQLLSVQIEGPATAYVNGYEIHKPRTEFLTIPKSTTYANVNGQIISSAVGSYIVVKEAVGAWNVNSGQTIDLYDTAQQRITKGVSSIAAPTGKKIGTARIKSISKDSGSLGTPDGAIRLHLFDISMLGSNSFASIKSVYHNNATAADIGGDVVLTGGAAKISDAYSGLLYYVGSNYTKTIRSPDGNVDTSFFFKKTSDVTISSSGSFSVTSDIANEIFPYGTTTLSTADKADIFLNINNSFNVAIPGTAISGSDSNSLVGSQTLFTYLNVGDKILLSNNTKSYIITSISNNSTLMVDGTLPTIESNTIFKAYRSGDLIDLSRKGFDGGETRTVDATPTALNFNLRETYDSTVSGTVTYTMAKTNAREIRKILRPNRYVLIDCATNSAGLTGPYNLGFSDVYRIKSIRRATSFSNLNDGVDVTNNFVLDNGQRDNIYKNASIIPYTTLETSDKILVCLDYFEPDYTLGVGYFSVDSYPVNDISPRPDQITTAQIPIFRSPDTGLSFDLKNNFDFRPVHTNTANDATSLSGITTNPSVSTTVRSDSFGLRLPADSESITFDYSYYLARKDIITLNQSGKYMITRGIPANTPITPTCPQHLMPIAKIYVAPYPSLSPSYAKILGRSDLACSSARTSQVRFTMKDIGVLKQRVDNLENYVSLSLLEKSALDMKILDENGLDRFKNGIFVDSFTSFNLSDYGNPDHHICYDPKEASIRPIHESQAIGYDFKSGTNVVVKNNLVMLPYTEVEALNQPFATTYRNVETTVYRFIGKIYLDPDSDYWVNTNRLASQTFSFGATDADVTPYSIVYGSYQTVVTGVSTTDPKLISSSGSVTGSTAGTVTGSQAYILSFAKAGSADGVLGYASIGGAGATTGTDPNAKVSDIDSLISMYGADTPITMSGSSMGGFASLGAGADLATRYSYIKTLRDIKANADKLAELNNFQIKITTTTGGTATSTTTNTYSTTTTTGTQATRAFTETFQSLKTDKQSIGDKLVAVAPIADIRPQTIAFEARGLKATTKHYVYFDGQLMSSYVTPASSTVTILGANTDASLITTSAKEGDSLYTDSQGFAYGFLRIPSDSTKSFRTGTKEFVITDSPSNEPDATSSAKAYFAAQGITQTVQETIISTSVVVSEEKTGVESKPIVYSNTTNTYSVTTSASVTGANSASGVLTDPVSCMAYSFKLNTPRGEEGTFLSSVDIFFAGKDPGLGVWFEIRAMDNAGNITKVQIPDSEVWLESNQVKTSDDGSVATNVQFKNPIFLLNNQEYAFVIHTVGINPNYYMYVCVLGKDDIISGLPVNSRPLTGTLFTTNNNTDWNKVETVDLKCKFYRAKFQTGVMGEAILGNQQREYVQLPLTPATGSNTSWFGERILGNDRLNLSGVTSGTISIGDYIIGSNSTTNTSVESINGSIYSMKNTGYISGEPITVRRANGLLTTITSSVVSKDTAGGRIYKVIPKNDPGQFNGNTAILVVDSTNGLFKANDTLHMEFSGNTVNTLSVTKQVYSAVQFEPSYLDFIPTTIDFSMSTTSNTGLIGGYESVVSSKILDFDTEMAIYSRSQEISTLNGVSSNRVKVELSSVSDYISPILNLNRTYTVYINNLINSNTANELLPSGGSLKNKYISQIVTLADGQDAEDLRIILSAYRPPGSNSDVKVYVRVANGEDFESIYKRNWIPMEAFNDGIYSSKSNRSDWREFNYKFPDSIMTGKNDQESPIIQYRNSANTNFEGFKQFQIKIGLQSDTSAIYPRVADLRAIALQK